MRLKRGRKWKTIMITETPMSSRREARKQIRQLHPEIDWHVHCVHHINHNSLDNDINNLRIMNTSEHTRHHRKIIVGTVGECLEFLIKHNQKPGGAPKTQKGERKEK